MVTATRRHPMRLSDELEVASSSDEAADAEAKTPTGCKDHETTAAERDACKQSFSHFLKHWHFKNRETGEVRTFANLWDGQVRAVAAMEEHPWLYLLKAGKLGFTELECAFDAWVALYRHQNAQVNLFSLDGEEAKKLLTMVRFGIAHLPPWLGLPIMRGEAGGDTTKQLKLRGHDPDDERTITSYLATKDAAIAVTGSHSHVDEIARMPWPEDTWSSVASTVAGSVHVVSRGHGEQNFGSDLYRMAESGESPLQPLFANWRERPRTPVRDLNPGEDGHTAWYAEQAATMTGQAMNYFAPENAEDALMGSGEDAFCPIEWWDACVEKTLKPLMDPQTGVVDQTPIILALDAGVTNDLFGVVAVSRHPERHDEVAVRAVRAWHPPKNGQINFDDVEKWVRLICETHNVVQITYDGYQLVDMVQRMKRDRVAWCKEFAQGDERLEADSDLRQLILRRRVAHSGEPDLRQHVLNAVAAVPDGEDTKLRIKKRMPKSKVDLLVALSMGVHRCLKLNMRQRDPVDWV